MKWTFPIIFSLYSLSAIAQVTFKDAANAAKSVPLPAFESIVTKATMEATLPPSSVGTLLPSPCFEARMAWVICTRRAIKNRLLVTPKMTLNVWRFRC